MFQLSGAPSSPSQFLRRPVGPTGGERPQARASRGHARAKHAATAEPSKTGARSRTTGRV